MKVAVVLALFACVAVSLAQPVATEEGSPVAPVPEKAQAPAQVAPAEGKEQDLDTANSYIYGGYPAYYGGYYGGYGGYPYYYGGYGAYGVPGYGYGYYY